MKTTDFRLWAVVTLLAVVCCSAASAHESCSACHINAQPQVGTAALTAPLPDLCIACHPDREGGAEHVIDVVQATPPRLTLPLLAGQVSCTTCHDPHSTVPVLLRFAPLQLCGACHQK